MNPLEVLAKIKRRAARALRTGENVKPDPPGNLSKEERSKLSAEELRDYFIYQHIPVNVRLEASTVCQLRCAGCGFQRGGKDGLERGFLSVEHFTQFCDTNPFVREIEISNYGEPFLNPHLVEIMHIAKNNGVLLKSWNGSNFNTVSDEQIRAMVDTGFRGITLSIDGASQDVYSQYRIGGNFDQVIENVKKLQNYKKEKGSEFPELKWQYILMEHNELEIGKAKELARELGIPIHFKLNWDASYKPINREYLLKETGLQELTMAEYAAAHSVSRFNSMCNEIFLNPQINWDGRLLGCCSRRYATFDVNVFDVGLVNAIRSPKYIEAKECLMAIHPDKERFSSCTCFDCSTRRLRESAGIALTIE